MNVVSGFAVGQLSAIAVWVATRRRGDFLSFLIPAVGLTLSSYLRHQIGFFREFGFQDYLCRNILQALVPFVVLWPFTRTKLWKWLTKDPIPDRRGYSIGNILIWTTAAAVLSVLVRSATWNNGQPVAITRWLGLLAPGTLALLVFAVHLLPIHCYIRLILQVLCGHFVGHYVAELGGNPFLGGVLKPEFATQAVVTGIFLEWTTAAWAAEHEDAGERACAPNHTSIPR